MQVEQEVLDYEYADSHVKVQPCKNNTLLATNLTWQSDRQYYEGDICYYNGRMYVARNNNIDKRPGIVTNWMLVFTETFRPSGLVPSNNVSDSNNDIDISSGRCWDSTGLVPIVGTAMTKRLDAAIALGSGTGGLFSGSKANSTLYYIFVIVKDNDGTTNYGFSTSLTATDRPSGWTTYACIGSFFTDSSGNIVNGTYTRYGDILHFTYKTIISEFTFASLPNNNRQLLTATGVPPNCFGLFHFNMYSGDYPIFVNHGPTTDTDYAPNSTANARTYFSSAGNWRSFDARYKTDSNKQIYIRSSNGINTSFMYKTVGYEQIL